MEGKEMKTTSSAEMTGDDQIADEVQSPTPLENITAPNSSNSLADKDPQLKEMKRRLEDLETDLVLDKIRKSILEQKIEILKAEKSLVQRELLYLQISEKKFEAECSHRNQACRTLLLEQEETHKEISEMQEGLQSLKCSLIDLVKHSRSQSVKKEEDTISESVKKEEDTNE